VLLARVEQQTRRVRPACCFTKPKAIFLDEAHVRHLNEGLEYALYQLLRSELPDLRRGQRQPSGVAVEPAPRTTPRTASVGGGWRLGPVEKQPAQVLARAYALPPRWAACAPARRPKERALT